MLPLPGFYLLCAFDGLLREVFCQLVLVLLCLSMGQQLLRCDFGHLRGRCYAIINWLLASRLFLRVAFSRDDGRLYLSKVRRTSSKTQWSARSQQLLKDSGRGSYIGIVP